jgi:hypothetical protein
VPPTYTTRDPFLKNRINSTLGFKKLDPVPIWTYYPELELAVLTCPSWYRCVFGGKFFHPGKEKKKGSRKGTNGFNLEKMGSSSHIMRGKKSKVAIFRGHKEQNYNRKPFFF